MNRHLSCVVGPSAILMAALLASCGLAAESPRNAARGGAGGDIVTAITKSGTLRVAVADAPPNIIKDAKTGEWKGVFPDLARDWSKTLGVKLEFHETTFGNMVSALQAGQVDVALDLTNTPERAQAVTFSKAVRRDIGAFTIAKTAATINSYSVLNRDSTSICVPQGTSYDLSLAKASLAAQIQRLPTAQDCYASLAANRVQAVYFGWTTSGQYAKAHQGTRVIFPPQALVDNSIALAVSKRYSAKDISKLDEFIDTWTSSPSGLSASVKRWAADANPIDYAVGDIPSYVREAATQTFGVSS